MNRRQRRASRSIGRKVQRGPWTPFEPQPLPRDTHPEFDRLHDVEEVWKNSRYVVQVVPEPCAWGDVRRFMVSRNDGGPIRDWGDLMRIKDELAGPERVAIEVYPARSELIDSANIYHLWVLPEHIVLPFTLSP